jgi:hypothetical protein
MIGKIANMGIYSGLAIETTLCPKTQPFLHDHQIDGTPVLPGVMGIEAFAEAALKALPDWRIEAIEDVNFLAPFKFYRNEARQITVEAEIHPRGEDVVADCRLIGRRTLPNQAEPQTTKHFTARVLLGKGHIPAVANIARPGEPQGLTIDASEIYQLYFHGPAYQVIEKAWWDGNRMIGLLAKDLPSNHVPFELPTFMSPRLIELCFQTAGLWEMGIQNRMGLPQHLDSVSVLAPEPAGVRLYAVITPDAKHGTFGADVIDADGNQYVRLNGYRTVALPNTLNEEQVKRLRAMLLPAPVAA